MTKPLTPVEALSAKTGNIPAFVVEAANELLVKNLSLQGRATIKLPDLIDLAVAKAEQACAGVSRQTMIENKWFDIEPLFRSAGWKVDFEKTSYADPHPSYFTFQRG